MKGAITLWPEQISSACPDTQAIDKNGGISCVSVPKVVPFLPPSGEANGTAILVCPGGGYSHLAWTEHVQRLAQRFTPIGIAVIGLVYRTAPPSENMPADAIADLQRALNIVNAHGDDWNIDPNRVVGLGFSAGANLLLHFSCTEASYPDKGEEELDDLKIGHMVLLCLWPYNRSADAYRIRPCPPRTFMCTTQEDETAPSEFTQAIGEKLRNAGGDVRIKVYPKGDHGAFNFKDSGPEVDWTSDLQVWLKDEGLL